MNDEKIHAIYGFAIFVVTVVSFWFGLTAGRNDQKPTAKCDYKCRCKLPQIFIDENTDIPNNPLKPLTPEEFQKLLDELRKRSKPEVGDGL